MRIYKYLIEFLDGCTLKTFSLEGESFNILRLHGAETFKLTSSNVADYWNQWKNESGYTSEDSIDICVVRGANVELKDFFQAGTELKTVAKTTWTIEELESFFSLTGQPIKINQKSFFGTIKVPAANGQKLVIGTIDKGYSVLKHPQTASSSSTKTATSTQPKRPFSKKNPATPQEISIAFEEMSNKHQTK